MARIPPLDRGRICPDRMLMPAAAAPGPYRPVGDLGSGLAVARRVHQRRGLGPPPDMQLLQDVVHVVLDRGRTDRELARDLLVGAALRGEREDLVFARGHR